MENFFCLPTVFLFIKGVPISRTIPLHTFFVEFLPDAISTYCEKCSEKQKIESRKITKFLIQNRRKDWEALEAKYDPNGSYRAKYAAELKKEGITL